MNYPLIAKYLGTVALLVGGAMLLSLPWAHPALGLGNEIEWRAILALLASALIAAGVGSALRWAGRKAEGSLYRKETMAIVGLSWVLASLLGAVPYSLCGAYREPAKDENPPIPMTPIDGLFESASGFSGTGATVIETLDTPELMPRAILFWRSETHFLGALGIMVLFVALLGQGSAGKALMRAEVPGPSTDSEQSRSQHAAWVFTVIYLGLNVVLIVILLALGMTPFDALCHSFGAVATGGFSTHNSSVGYYSQNPEQFPYYLAIEAVIAVFMLLASTNFALLYAVFIARPGKLFRDIEFRAYFGLICIATIIITWYGVSTKNYSGFLEAFRFSSFQVISIVTTTGYATHNFNEWNEIGRGLMFLLMFVGGCAGSTGGSMKLIRHVMFVKILRLEVERAYRPTVVRPLRVGGRPVDDPDLRRNVVVYFGLLLFIVVTAWMLLLVLEPDSGWLDNKHEKLMDTASAVAATVNGVGPGLGTIGASETYSHFAASSKLVFVMLMLLGRLEIYVILVLFIPSFWRGR